MKAKGDIALMFGFRLLQDLRDIHMECQIIRDQEQSHYTTEIDTIRRYYQDSRKAFSQPGMEDFLTESRDDVENNLKDTISTLERQRDETMERLETECSFRVKSLLASRKSEALSYAQYLLRHDIADFMRLCIDVGEYANQLEVGVQYCQKLEEADKKSASAYEYCYGPEVTILVKFIRQFVTEAIAYAENFFGDDEDYTYSGLGEEATEEPTSRASSPSQSPATSSSTPPTTVTMTTETTTTSAPVEEETQSTVSTATTSTVATTTTTQSPTDTTPTTEDTEEPTTQQTGNTGSTAVTEATMPTAMATTAESVATEPETATSAPSSRPTSAVTQPTTPPPVPEEPSSNGEATYIFVSVCLSILSVRARSGEAWEQVTGGSWHVRSFRVSWFVRLLAAKGSKTISTVEAQLSLRKRNIAKAAPEAWEWQENCG